MQRREFMRLSGAAMAGLSVGACLPVRSRPAWPARAEGQGLLAVEGVPGPPFSEAQIRAALTRAIDAVGGLAFLAQARRGGPRRTVLVKPALNSSQPFPATTSPLSIAHVVRLIKERDPDARVIVGDRSGIFWPTGTLHNFEATGIARAVAEERRAFAARVGGRFAEKGADIELVDLGDEGWVGVHPAGADHWRFGFGVPRLLDRVTDIVLLPRCSAHVLTGHTMALKLQVGLCRPADRMAFHYLAMFAPEMGALMTELNLAIADRIRLIVMDATYAQGALGPDFGPSFPAGLVLASRDLVTADVAGLAAMRLGYRLRDVGAHARAARIAGVGPWRGSFVREAVERGLGVTAPEQIQLVHHAGVDASALGALLVDRRGHGFESPI